MSTITKSIIVDAPPSVVFRALTDEKELVHWMPRQAKFDARLGGEYEFRYYWARRNLEATAKGKILEPIPNKRLFYSFNSVRAGTGTSLTESTVTWTLEELLRWKDQGHPGAFRSYHGGTGH